VAALVSSFFGGSFSAALPVIGPFAVANRTPDVPRMVVFPFHSDIQAAAISKDNTTMFIVDRFNNVVRVIDLSAREQTSTITVGRPPIVNSANSAPPDGTVVAGIRPTSIMVSPVKNDYRAFVTGQSSDEEAVRILNPDSSFPEKHSVANTLAVIDTKTFEVVETYAVGVEPLGMAVTPDGKKVYVANAGTGAETVEFIPSNTVSIVNTDTKEVKTIEVGTSPTFMVMTPDGRKAYGLPGS
jgi:DNA-binding beta-propeller fold protein YncE